MRRLDFTDMGAVINSEAGRIAWIRPASLHVLLAALNSIDAEASWCDGVSELSAVQWDTAQNWVDTAIKDILGGFMIGAVLPFVRATLPDGVLLCDGSTYNKADYPNLWDVLPSWMKNATTFDVPDLADKFVRGGIAGDIGVTGGEDTHTLSTGEIPAHNHGVYIIGDLDVESIGVPQPNAAQLSPVVATYTANAGGGGAHENRPVFYTVVWGIVAW